MAAFEVNSEQDKSQLQQCQANVLNTLFGFAIPLAIKSVVELRIPDIIHSYGQPMSLTNIALKIDHPSIDISCLLRVMRLLARKKFFTIHGDPSSIEALYGLTRNSSLLLNDHEFSLAPIFLTITNPYMMTTWLDISRWIKEGGILFDKIYGKTFWENMPKDDGFNDLFNKGMESFTQVNLTGILMSYKDGFDKIQGTVIDVGGGIGHAIAAIVKAHPHIKGINFDLPHVVATAPQYHGVTHISGDVFDYIPTADAIFMKGVLHDWGDEECVKILKNCRKTIVEKNGKVIIVDIVLKPEGNGLFDDMNMIFDIEMAIHVDGKERTENEWNKLFKEAKFSRYNIIEMPFGNMSIIEAYP